MRRTSIRQPMPRRSTRRNRVMPLLASIVCAILGFLLSAPFFVVFVFLGYNFHHMNIWIYLMLGGLFIGGPLLFLGVISMLIGNTVRGSSSTADIDLARIRYQAENERN